MMYGGFGYGNGYEFMRGGMMFMMFIGLILIAAVVYFVVKGNSGHAHNQNYAYNNVGSNALDILNEKFAKGEISEEEYSTKKRMISGR